MGRLILALGLAALFLPLHAANLVVEDAWIRSTAPLQPVAGAFMKLTSDTNATLVGASSPAAGKVEVHMMRMQDGVMFMRPVKKLSLPKGQTIELKPGGYHIMLMNIKQAFKAGETVPLVLKIRSENKIQTVSVKAEVRDMMDPDAGPHQH
jgi:copper(I)-binding protein